MQDRRDDEKSLVSARLELTPPPLRRYHLESAPRDISSTTFAQQTPRVTFESAAQMLETFAMQEGSEYRRLVGAFQRIAGVTIFFGTDTQRERATVVHSARFNFMSEAPIWYSTVPKKMPPLPNWPP